MNEDPEDSEGQKPDDESSDDLESDAEDIFEVWEVAAENDLLDDDDALEARDGYTGDLIPFNMWEEVLVFYEHLADLKERLRDLEERQRAEWARLILTANALLAFNVITIIALRAFLMSGDIRLLVGDTALTTILIVLAHLWKRRGTS